ncbi:unnamed protein product [Cochlearia groenlandica]
MTYHVTKAEGKVKTQVRLRQNQSRVRLRQNRSHKCKRDQGIVRTSLVHQDDDLHVTKAEGKLTKSLALLVTVAKGNARRPLPREPLGRVTCVP